jgi:malate dehydrogenase
MKRVSIIGGGNVGANTAFFIAENRSASVTLVDIKEGLGIGKALDLSEAGPIRRYDTAIRGTSDVRDIQGSDIVVIAAGKVRNLGQTRDDLYLDNAPLAVRICDDIKHLAPNAVVINVIEPVDMITLRIQEALGFERTRVLGVGGLLSSTRLRYLVSNALGVSPREVTGMVVGPHRKCMVVLRDTVRVSGIPVGKLMSPAEFDAIITEVREAGDTILQMAQRSTSYYASSAAIASLVEAVARDTQAILPVSFRLQGEYDLHDICISIPAQLGVQGIVRPVTVPLTEAEQGELRDAVAEVKTSLERVATRTTAPEAPPTK